MSGLCTRTGLAYVEGPVTGFRIAKTSYGPLKLLARPEAAADHSGWSRFDTAGSTIYLAGDAGTAYAETLAMARMSRKYRSAIKLDNRDLSSPWPATRSTPPASRQRETGSSRALPARVSDEYASKGRSTFCDDVWSEPPAHA
jgi:hypothetical protein